MAELLAVKVSVLVPVAGLGLKAAVTPLPIPLADKLTLPANPLDGVIVIVDVPLDDRVIVKLVGDADSVKLPAATAVTVSVTVALCAVLPPVPVTVMVYVPVAVVEATAILIVELPDPGAAIVAGVKLTVTPAGCPLAVKAIAELNPPVAAVVIVDAPLAPCTTETEPGDAEIVKSGVVDVGASALINPVPFGLPHPVTRSYPVTAE